VNPQDDAVYFDALGFLLVRYPAWLAAPFALGVLLLFAAVIWLGFRRGKLTGSGIAKGALLFFLSLIAAAAAVGGAWWLVRQIQPGYSLIPQGDSYRHGLYVIGFALLTLASTAAIVGSFGRRIREADLFAGGLLWWAVSMVAATIWMVGSSYLPTWPLFFALLGLGYAFIRGDGVRRLRLHLVSPRGAERMSIQISTEILSATVDGKPLTSGPTTQKSWSLLYLALPKDGIELVLETRSTLPLSVRLMDESYGLPLLDGEKLKDRPAHMMPAPFFRSDVTLVSQSYSL
jgi:hypothetical protein